MLCAATEHGPERGTTGCGCVIIRTSHGATTAREIGSSTAACGDRSEARRAVGGVAGPGSAQTKKEVSVQQGSLIVPVCPVGVYVGGVLQ